MATLLLLLSSSLNKPTTGRNRGNLPKLNGAGLIDRRRLALRSPPRWPMPCTNVLLSAPRPLLLLGEGAWSSMFCTSSPILLLELLLLEGDSATSRLMYGLPNMVFSLYRISSSVSNGLRNAFRSVSRWEKSVITSTGTLERLAGRACFEVHTFNISLNRN